MNTSYLFFLFLLTTILSGCKQHQPEPLFPIEKDGKIGFINSKGIVIIQPQFRSAGLFSEGLAPVRMGGTYGYIDATGKWVIPPQFDYAIPFSEGFAVVYKEAEPFYINRKGEKVFEAPFEELGNFKDGRAVVKTMANRYGIIDRDGRLFIDTVFSDIRSFQDGLAIVEGWDIDYKQRADKPLKVGVIDTKGRFIIPYLKYRYIMSFVNGYFQAQTPSEKNDTLDGSSAQTQFLDRNGKVVLSQSHKSYSYAVSDVNCGLIRMGLYKKPIAKGGERSTDNSYASYADLKGNMVIHDTAFSSATDFSNNRAFVEIRKGKWEHHYRMIDTKGNFVSDLQLNGVNDKGFVDGLAIVQTNPDWEWGVVDTNARFIVQPHYKEIIRMRNYFVVGIPGPKPNSNYPLLYGIVELNGKIVLKPIMKNFDQTGFKDSLLQCVIDNRLAYVHENGKIIWRQDIPKKSVANLNIDYMNRGYFYAASAPDANDPGEFGGSGNAAHNITTKHSFPSDKLSIVVFPDSVTKFQEQYNGMKVFVINNTAVPVQFDASDSRLYMKVQAKNPKGEWADIEYLPSSWCGNSYHTLSLQQKQYWSFNTPNYEGDFKTKLRVQLTYLDPKEATKPRRERKELTIYSNEYTGGVNPSQFWRKQDYYTTNIMDPYLE